MSSLTVVIVTGLSGGGKASILRALEDTGYEAVDNPPLTMLEEMIARGDQKLAVGIDARTRGFDATDVIDALTRLRMQALVTALWQAHLPAVLLVTHDVDEALTLADRALVLDQGRITLDVQIDLPRPRRHDSPAFGKQRTALLSALGVEEV